MYVLQYINGFVCRSTSVYRYTALWSVSIYLTYGFTVSEPEKY